jgi:hypothetical protein
VANLCKKNNTDITITDTILNELEPGYYLEIEDDTAKNIYNAVHNLVNGTRGLKLIRIIKLGDIPGAKEELKKIRMRFYGWMNDVNYLHPEQNLFDEYASEIGLVVLSSEEWLNAIGYESVE